MKCPICLSEMSYTRSILVEKNIYADKIDCQFCHKSYVVLIPSQNNNIIEYDFRFKVENIAYHLHGFYNHNTCILKEYKELIRLEYISFNSENLHMEANNVFNRLLKLTAFS